MVMDDVEIVTATSSVKNSYGFAYRIYKNYVYVFHIHNMFSSYFIHFESLKNDGTYFLLLVQTMGIIFFAYTQYIVRSGFLKLTKSKEVFQEMEEKLRENMVFQVTQKIGNIIVEDKL